MTGPDRVLSWLATGPAGRFVAFWLGLGAAIGTSLRRRLGLSGPRH